MLKEKPRIRVADLIAVFFILLAMLIFVVILFVLSINSTGNTYEILNTMFIVFLRIYEGILVFAGVAIVIHLLRVLAWYVITPKWLQKKYNGGGKQ